jgi:hypothetical protein
MGVHLVLTVKGEAMIGELLEKAGFGIDGELLRYEDDDVGDPELESKTPKLEANGEEPISETRRFKDELSDSEASALVRELEHVELKLLALNLNQEEYAQVRAYVVAAKILASAPKPPADIIWQILMRASQFAGIVSLLVATIALLTR